VSGAAIAYLSYGCTFLTKINISDGDMFDDKAIGALRSLKHLVDVTAERLPNLTHRGVKMLIEGGDGYTPQHEGIEEPSLIEGLLHLRLNECENVEGAVVIEAVSRAKATRKIQTLELGNTCPISSAAQELTQLNGLTMLNEDEVNVDAEILKKLCYNCTDLTKLDLCGVPAMLSKKSLYTLSARLRKNLTSLNIGKCQLDSADAFNPLRAMKPKLTSLSISDSPYLLDGIAAHFPVSITQLDVSNCPKLSNHFLENLHLSCPNLVNLDVSSNPLISDAGLLHFLDTEMPLDEYAQEAARVGTLEHFSCVGTNISDTALDELARRTRATSLLTAEPVVVGGGVELASPEYLELTNEASLPCMVVGRKEQDTRKDTHFVKMIIVLYDFEMEDMDASRAHYFKKHISKLLDMEGSDVLNIVGISGEPGSLVVEVRVTGFRSSPEAEDTVTRILSKQTELVDVYQFGRFKLQSVEVRDKASSFADGEPSIGEQRSVTFPLEPEEKSVQSSESSLDGSSPMNNNNNNQSVQRKLKKQSPQPFRGVKPIGGSQAAMERRMFLTRCAQRDLYAPKLQKWARQRLEVKHVCARYKLESDSCKMIQRLFRMWHTQQYFYRALEFRRQAASFIQRSWRKYLKLQKIHRIINGYRVLIQGRAFSALRESMGNTQAKGDKVKAMAFRLRQHVWLLKWHQQLVEKRRIFDEMADKHYANSILRKSVKFTQTSFPQKAKNKNENININN
jgi:hypothetical protein